MRLRLLTAGESHGPALVAVLDGLPAGVPVDPEALSRELRRRQGGYGRGSRMRIENDRAEILSGVRLGRTLGSPVALRIPNADYRNWTSVMDPSPQPPDAEDAARRKGRLRAPRPGHADLAGCLRGWTDDPRDILERASARDTAARVAAGALCKALLAEAGIRIGSHVTRIGGVALAAGPPAPAPAILALPDDSPLRCVDSGIQDEMIRAVDEARKAGDTLGGRFEVVAVGVPPGLGTHTEWDRRLDARIAHALMSIPAVKAVEIGEGIAGASERGSAFHDPILPAPTGLRRPTNRAGGIEGGISNGEEVRVACFMKPLSTLVRNPLPSVDLATGEPATASVERSDVCAVPAAGVVGEAMLALVLADSLLEKCGGDSLRETLLGLARHREEIARAPGGGR